MAKRSRSAASALYGRGRNGPGGYVGARYDRSSTQEWFAPQTTGNGAVLPDLAELQARSHDLTRNTPLAAGAIDTNLVSIVGAGLVPQPSVDWKTLGLDEAEGNAINAKLRSLFDAWASGVQADITERASFYDLQWQACRMWLVSGDGLGVRRFIDDPMAPFGLRLQLIEGDRISNPRGAMDTTEIAGGVEMDQYGRAVAYHVEDTADIRAWASVREWIRLPVRGSRTGERRVLYLGQPDRAGQLRSVPLLSPVIETIKSLGRYADHELMAAVASSMITLFIKRDANATGGTYPGLTSTDEIANTPSGVNQLKLRPGAAAELQPGEDIVSFNPQRPNPQFDPFFTAMTKQIGMATGLPFELLMMHFSASYSASRAALLEAWRRFERRRAWLARAFCQPVYEWFLDEVQARGLIDMPGWDDPMLRRAWSYCVWSGPSRGEIDELRAAEAMEKRLDLNVTTLEQETNAYNGGDWEANLEQKARERALLDRYGIAPAGAPAGAIAAVPSPRVPPDPNAPDPTVPS
jgi:lambda family phage portal protein